MHNICTTELTFIKISNIIFGCQNGNKILTLENIKDMEVVTAREFRSNQGKFLIAAREGQSVLLTSRYGNFKITPVTSEDMIVERDLREAVKQVKDHMEGRIELPNARDIEF